MQAARVEDLDLGAFRAYLRALGLETEEEPQPASEDDLRNRGAVVGEGSDLRPTLALAPAPAGAGVFAAAQLAPGMPSP